MRYTTLGRTGLRASVLGLGCGRSPLSGAGTVRENEQEAARVMHYALDRGVNLISAGYGEVNELIGRRMAGRRDEFILTSKATSLGSRTYDVMMKGIEDQLKILRTDHFDIFEFSMARHAEDLAQAMGPGGAVEAMEKAKEQGKILNVGVTSHRPDMAAAAVRTGRIDNVLVIYNLVNPYATEDLMPVVREYNVGVMAMRPLSHGALCPVDRAFEYLWANGVHVAVSAMVSVEEVEENVRVAEREPDPERYAQVLKEAGEIQVNGCRMCCLCSCSGGEMLLLQLWNYRKIYKLCASAEEACQKYVNSVQFDYEHFRESEAQCPYGVPIVKEMEAIAEATKGVGVGSVPQASAGEESKAWRRFL